MRVISNGETMLPRKPKGRRFPAIVGLHQAPTEADLAKLRESVMKGSLMSLASSQSSETKIFHLGCPCKSIRIWPRAIGKSDLLRRCAALSKAPL